MTETASATNTNTRRGSLRDVQRVQGSEEKAAFTRCRTVNSAPCSASHTAEGNTFGARSRRRAAPDGREVRRRHQGGTRQTPLHVRAQQRRGAAAQFAGARDTETPRQARPGSPAGRRARKQAFAAGKIRIHRIDLLRVSDFVGTAKLISQAFAELKSDPRIGRTEALRRSMGH